MPSVKATVLFSNQRIKIVPPPLPLNCQLDGGHLLVEPHREFSSRIYASAEEAIQLMAATMLAGQALTQVLKVEEINYQEMANWQLAQGNAKRMQIHVFGRSAVQRYQTRGESIRFFARDHPIYTSVYQPLSTEIVLQLWQAIEQQLQHQPFRKLMA
ncbi:MAG: hypothetical protein OFPI_24520 [Osedax symbiont Rs2]|nr:MAG: hypothetical protein OFPI_24520 [Osedax symbiont Rs2]